MSDKNFEKATIKPIEEPAKDMEKVVSEIEDTNKIGVVTNCLKLNVRKAASIDADVLCEIRALSSVVINEKESTDEFYKVVTEMGVSGFCKKEYIAIQ